MLRLGVAALGAATRSRVGTLVALRCHDALLSPRARLALDVVLAALALDAAAYRVEPVYALHAALHLAFAARSLLDVFFVP